MCLWTELNELRIIHTGIYVIVCNAFLQVFTQACVHVCMKTYTHTHVHMHMHTHMRMHAHTHMHTHICMYRHMHIHTQGDTLVDLKAYANPSAHMEGWLCKDSSKPEPGFGLDLGLQNIQGTRQNQDYSRCPSFLPDPKRMQRKVIGVHFLNWSPCSRSTCPRLKQLRVCFYLPTLACKVSVHLSLCCLEKKRNKEEENRY